MLTTIWDQFLMLVHQEVGSRVVETWLKAVSLYKWDSLQKVVYVQAPNSFVKEWIKANYLSLFQSHLARLLNVDAIKVVFVDGDVTILSTTDESVKIVPAQLVSADNQKNKMRLMRAGPLRSQLNKNYLFETFVVGPNSQMAYAAACAITQKLGRLYNPLFFYGGCGLGKTHLLHAIGNELKMKQKQVEVLYQPADRFVNEFIHAIRFDKVNQFQARYKDIDVLLVDDVQCISNKEQTQEAFYHIFNSLYDAHKQIVFSSDSYPSDIQGLAERLRSRLAWGLVADIQMPTIETKIAILKRKADLQNEDLPDEVAHYIASQVNSNIRELEGALIRISAYAGLMRESVTLDIAKKVLLRGKDVTKPNSIDFDRIVASVATQYNYTLTDLRSKNRSKQLSLARQLAMYFMKQLTNKSLQEIAHYLGRTDHSTVIHALRSIDERMQQDHTFCDQLNRIKQEIVHSA